MSVVDEFHGARDYRDDTEAFFSDLEKGEKISVVLAPSFFLDFMVTGLKVLSAALNLLVLKRFTMAAMAAKYQLILLLNLLKSLRLFPLKKENL